MPEYQVVWRIYVEAATPLAAARQALSVQRDRESWATMFEVYDESESRAFVDVDDEVYTLTIVPGRTKVTANEARARR